MFVVTVPEDIVLQAVEFVVQSMVVRYWDSGFPGTFFDEGELMSVVQTQIVSDPKIHGGEPLVEGTSTTVRAIAELWNQGMPAEEIPVHLSHIELAQVFEALRYYLTHRDEVESFIFKNRIPDNLSGKQFDAATGKIQ